ncbi:g_PROTEIN_RECEP_F1_2 domain-containing protein [Caerostris extrusa]|uniref:G_PROTEIN_RECEP_F1_2 domain-containing protein n=1 Tax=Caerostris extrusa TaxID=172846 RepID=A0AAV4Y3D8_CAEEX|nr:g_PROTEIN_RECEP_F1_2 domain-containing protein [Caerostris extrusa]
MVSRTDVPPRIGRLLKSRSSHTVGHECLAAPTYASMLTSSRNSLSAAEHNEIANGETGNGYSFNSENNHVVLDSPQCIIFGLFIIWFASFTINLGPTFLSGALSSAREGVALIDACPMVYAPVRHYVLNVLWVTVNLMCIILTGIHLRKLYRDLTKSNLEALRIAGLVTTMISVRSERELCESRQIQSYIDRLEKEGIRRVKMFVVLFGCIRCLLGTTLHCHSDSTRSQRPVDCLRDVSCTSHLPTLSSILL